MPLLTLLMSAVDILVIPTASACSFPSAYIAPGQGTNDVYIMFVHFARYVRGGALNTHTHTHTHAHVT